MLVRARIIQPRARIIRPNIFFIKGPLSGLRQFLIIESPVTILTGKNSVLLYSVQEYIEIEAWQLRTFDLLATSDQRFSGVFRGYKMGMLAGNGLKEYRCLKKIIHQIERKWMVNPFSKFYNKISIVFLS